MSGFWIRRKPEGGDRIKHKLYVIAKLSDSEHYSCFCLFEGFENSTVVTFPSFTHYQLLNCVGRPL